MDRLGDIYIFLTFFQMDMFGGLLLTLALNGVGVRGVGLRINELCQALLGKDVLSFLVFEPQQMLSHMKY